MMSLTLIGTLRCCGNISIMSLVPEHGKQCMPCYANFSVPLCSANFSVPLCSANFSVPLCSANFSVPLQTEILLTETSDFLTQIIILMSFNYVLKIYQSVCDNVNQKTEFSNVPVLMTERNKKSAECHVLLARAMS